MTDKWTIGSSNEELYNGVRPLEEGDTREKEETSRNNYGSICEKYNLKESILSKIVPLRPDSNPLNSPNLTLRT